MVGAGQLWNMAATGTEVFQLITDYNASEILAACLVIYYLLLYGHEQINSGLVAANERSE